MRPLLTHTSVWVTWMKLVRLGWRGFMGCTASDVKYRDLNRSYYDHFDSLPMTFWTDSVVIGPPDSTSPPNT